MVSLDMSIHPREMLSSGMIGEEWVYSLAQQQPCFRSDRSGRRFRPFSEGFREDAWSQYREYMWIEICTWNSLICILCRLYKWTPKCLTRQKIAKCCNRSMWRVVWCNSQMIHKFPSRKGRYPSCSHQVYAKKRSLSRMWRKTVLILF